MSIEEIKANFHHLIDEIETIELLKKVCNLLKDYPKENDTNDFWDDLSDEQKAEIDTTLEESEHEENLIPHNKVKQEAKTWLKKQSGWRQPGTGCFTRVKELSAFEC